MADITAVALYLHYWTTLQVVPQWVFALIALVLVFILNMLNVKMFGEAEFWFALIKVAAIVSFMVVAIVAIVLRLHTGTASDGGAITAGAHNILGNGGFFPEGFPIVFALTLGVVFAFGGTEMVGVAAGEAKDAEKILPKAINSMILRIFVFYVGSVMLLALVLPYTSYSKTESPFVTFFSGIGVPYAGDIIQVVVLTAALSSLNAGLYATGRTLRSMAVAGEAPRVAAGLNKHQVPAGGIIITSALGLLGVLLNAYLPGDAFDIVMNLARHRHRRNLGRHPRHPPRLPPAGERRQGGASGLPDARSPLEQLRRPGLLHHRRRLEPGRPGRAVDSGTVRRRHHHDGGRLVRSAGTHPGRPPRGGPRRRGGRIRARLTARRRPLTA